MANSAAPTIILINSHSAFGFHKGQLNTLEWSPTPSVGGSGSIATHNAGSVDADEMINDLIDLFVPFFPASNVWDNYVIFTYPTPEATPEPMASGTLGQIGTSATPGWTKAVQQTLTFRTDLFGVAKIVMLDADSQDSFDKTLVVPPASPLEALVNMFTDEDLGWAGRDNGRPDTYLSATKTLNEKLRREYRMA